MFERNFIVKYVEAKDSFIRVSSYMKLLVTGTCVELTFGNDKNGYFSVIPSTISLEQNMIGIGSLFAKTLNIQENDVVLLREVQHCSTITSITICPVSNNDYVVLELLAENVQDTLLRQINIVYSGQRFIIWIGGSIHVTVLVDNVVPVSPGALGFLTEVHINPFSDNIPKKNLDNHTSSNQKSLVDFARFRTLTNFYNTENEAVNSLQKFYNLKQEFVYRLVQATDLPYIDKLGGRNKIFNAFAINNEVTREWSIPIFCSITLINNDVFSKKTIYVRLIFIEYIKNNLDMRMSQNLFVSEDIFNYFECDVGSRVLLEYVDKVTSIDEIGITCKKNNSINIEDHFRTFMARNSQDVFVLNSDFPLDIGDHVICSLKFFPIGSNFCVVDDNLIKNCKYYVNDEHVTLKVNEKTKNRKVDHFIDTIGNYGDIIQKTLRNICGFATSLENTIIIGKSGTGKSSLLRIMETKLQAYPNFIYTKTLKCKNIKGKTMDSLLKLFTTAFFELVLHQPSLLFLDDLHILCQNVQEDEAAPNTIYFNRISEMLHNLFKLFAYPHVIGICATAECVEKINKHIYSSRGSHLFKNVYCINDITKEDRKVLLKEVFKSHQINNLNFDELSLKTEGFVVQDVIDFYNKTIFEATKDEFHEEESDVLVISDCHCENALKNTCVLALQNVKLHSPGDKDYSDIGGLDNVKKILVESLVWPVQYPSIFSNAPLRLQSGLLLYGPPGTGKTLLAAAAAKQCQLRLISVKGPELLSKYIGASEQAVRDVFQKAQTVRPCILFFDEFDSLAPRRGHDNTGVTDRVVNQLLTQLDGVESLTGVCVLAATSRPDLLDPALLRPGRLDKQIHCPLPNKSDRLDILRVLSKNLDLDGDVNMEEIAASAEYYSGADLQSLLYTAQLATIGHLLFDKEETSSVPSKITQSHLLDALRQSKPSLPQHERIKYERIYDKFHKGSIIDDYKTGTKATLA